MLLDIDKLANSYLIKNPYIRRKGVCETIHKIIRDPKYHTITGSVSTNIACPGIGTACISNDYIQSFLDIIENVRRSNLEMTLFERQDFNNSGINMCIYAKQPKEITNYQYTQTFFEKLIHAIFKIICEKCDIKQYPDEYVIVGVTYAKSIITGTTIDGNEYNSATFNLVIPGLKISRTLKRQIFNIINQRQIIRSVFEESKIITTIPATINELSAYCMTAFIGYHNHWSGLPTHELMHTFNVNIETLTVSVGRSMTKINIAGEFSLNHETKQKYIKKVNINPIV